MKYFLRIYSKVNRVIYSSLPIYSSNFKALTSIVFRCFADMGKIPKLTKGHYSWNSFKNLFKSYSGHLLITTNLFIKFQGSSSNCFWDILLTKWKCPKLQRAITHEVFFRIYSKVIQVIYSPLLIYSLSFKALIVFEILCWQGKIPKFIKGHYSWNIFQNFIHKLFRSSTHHYQSINQVSRL